MRSGSIGSRSPRSNISRGSRGASRGRSEGGSQVNGGDKVRDEIRGQSRESASNVSHPVNENPE